MAGRIRSIKPELLEDEATATLDDTEWRAFVSFLLVADDYGNFRANPKQLDGAIFWAHDDERDWDFMRARLAKLVLFWEEEGQLYGHIRTWARHQRVDKPGKPRCPKPSQELLDRPVPPIPPRRTRNSGDPSANSQIREGLAKQSGGVAGSGVQRVAEPRSPAGSAAPEIQETPARSQIREGLATDLRSPISDHRPPTSDARDGDGGPANRLTELVGILRGCPKLAGEDHELLAMGLDGIGGNVGTPLARVVQASRLACSMVLTETEVRTASHAAAWVRKTTTRLMRGDALERELKGGDGREHEHASGTSRIWRPTARMRGAS